MPVSCRGFSPANYCRELCAVGMGGNQYPNHVIERPQFSAGVPGALCGHESLPVGSLKVCTAGEGGRKGGSCALRFAFRLPGVLPTYRDLRRIGITFAPLTDLAGRFLNRVLV